MNRRDILTTTLAAPLAGAAALGPRPVQVAAWESFSKSELIRVLSLGHFSRSELVRSFVRTGAACEVLPAVYQAHLHRTTPNPPAVATSTDPRL